MKKLREAKGLTRAELAKLAGINVRTLEAYEYGRKDINNAKLKTLLNLCIALECRLDDILTDTDLIMALYEYETPGLTAAIKKALEKEHHNKDLDINFTREKFDEIIKKTKKDQKRPK